MTFFEKVIKETEVLKEAKNNEVIEQTRKYEEKRKSAVTATQIIIPFLKKLENLFWDSATQFSQAISRSIATKRKTHYGIIPKSSIEYDKIFNKAFISIYYKPFHESYHLSTILETYASFAIRFVGSYESSTINTNGCSAMSNWKRIYKPELLLSKTLQLDDFNVVKGKNFIAKSFEDFYKELYIKYQDPIRKCQLM